MGQKILLVTGASSEVGCELIRNCINQYDIVLAHYCHNRDELDKLKLEYGEKLVILQADFERQDEVERLICEIEEKKYFPSHIVHLPSEKVFPQKFHKIHIDYYKRALDTSVSSIVLILNHFIPEMLKHKHGKIIFMLSAITLNIPLKYQAPYAISKYALLGLMKDLAGEYAEKGIMINGVSPDMMDTKFLSEMPELIKQNNAVHSPLKRNLTVRDVVPTFIYLLSDAANAITGQNLGITGGNN